MILIYVFLESILCNMKFARLTSHPLYTIQSYVLPKLKFYEVNIDISELVRRKRIKVAMRTMTTLPPPPKRYKRKTTSLTPPLTNVLAQQIDNSMETSPMKHDLYFLARPRNFEKGNVMKKR